MNSGAHWPTWGAVCARGIGFLCVSLGFFVLYFLLGSRDYADIDGAMRGLSVYHSGRLEFHANNHMLYPVNVWSWNWLMALIYGEPTDPVDFLRRTQVMNALAASVSVGLLALIMHYATGSLTIAAGTALAFGSSRAMLLHATNSAEPPVGLALSISAVAMAVFSRSQFNRAWVATTAGFLLAAAMATYQTMVLYGPLVFLLCCTRGGARDARHLSTGGMTIRSVVYLGLGTALGVMGIYGWAYSQQGVTSVGGQLRRFLSVDGGASVYGGISLSKSVNIFPGFVGNVFYAYRRDHYQGIRSMLRHHLTDGWFLWLLVVLLAVAVVGVCLLCFLRRHWTAVRPDSRWALLMAAVAVAFPLIGPVYWEPTYDKMWLQPIAAFMAFVGLGLAALPPSKERRFLLWSCAFLLVVEAGSNMVWAIPMAQGEPRFVLEARQVEALLRPEDLIVYEWDRLSKVHLCFFGHRHPHLSFPTVAHERHAAIVEDLRQMVREARHRGGQVYFLGLMDHSPASWNAFLGDRLSVPYDRLDEFRNACQTVASFNIAGQLVTLRMLDSSVESEP